uniref:Uncharacterized protein n=1 Tax=Plectus sambesii TaxID=2011161 RepID=A0A914UL69_9BILA
MTSFHSRLRQQRPFDQRPWFGQPPPPPPRGLSRYASMQQLDVTVVDQSSPTSDDSDQSPVQQHKYQRKRSSDDGYSSSSYAAASTPINGPSHLPPSRQYGAATLQPRSAWSQPQIAATMAASGFGLPLGLHKMDEERTVYRQPPYGSTGQANGDFCANSQW